MFKISQEQRDNALSLLINRWGIDYQLGAEVAPGQLPTATVIDCSELVQRVYNDVLEIKMPDGSFNQLPFCKVWGRMVDYPQEKALPLDLVFLWNHDGTAIDHVAIVYGEILPKGGVVMIEARGRPWNHVMLTPLDKFINQFGKRFAGMWRVADAT